MEGGNYTLEAKLSPEDVSEGDYFGYSVDICGDTLIVGAPLDDGIEEDSGSVYVYTRKNESWVLQSKITVDEYRYNKAFGTSVAISSDTILVGSPMRSVAHLSTSNAFVFIRNGNEWIQQAVLRLEPGDIYSAFGSRVDLDNDTAVVCDYRDDTNGVDSGSVYIYMRSGNEWIQHAKLMPSKINSNYFGASLSISGDAILVSSVDTLDTENSTASAYIFVRQGHQWVQEAVFPTGDSSLGKNLFNYVSIDGDIAVIGSHFREIGPANNSIQSFSGLVSAYKKSGNVWNKLLERNKEDIEASHAFPKSLCIRNDIVVVSDSADLAVGGKLYIYDLGVPPANVTFNLDGKAIRQGGGELTQLVKLGENAIEPQFKVNSGWYFASWDSGFSEVNEDMAINAHFYDSTNTDGDSLWDGWELAHFSDLSITDGNKDSDGDGQSDRDEFVSGSNPQNSTDIFCIEKAEVPEDGKMKLRFKTNNDLGNRRYRILYTYDLGSADWTELPMGTFAPDIGTYTERIFDFPRNTDRCFFKVEAFLE